MIAKRVPRTTNPTALDAVLVDQSAAGRIDPLLIAETAEEMLCNFDFGELSLPEISPDVLMVQSSQERLGDDAANCLNRPRNRCILAQR
jgi:hypothetical protein